MQLAACAVSVACGAAPAPALDSPPPSWTARAEACRGERCEAECAALLDEPSSPELLRGDVAVLCGRDRAALAAYERAWSGGPRTCRLTHAIADLRGRLGDEAGALDIATAGPGCRALDLWVAAYARERAPAVAERTIRRWLERDPDDAEFLAAQVRWLVARGSASLTTQTCERADRLADAGLHGACAAASLTLDAQQATERHLRRATSLGPTPLRWVDLGEFLLDQRRFGEAADAFRAALALAEDDYDATVGLGRALAPTGWHAARELFSRAQRVSPERPEAFLFFGEMTGDRPCEDIDASRASLASLDRFVELARGDPAFAEAIQAVTHVCHREERRARRRRSTCVPGLVQRHLFVCRPALRLQPRSRSARLPTATDERARLGRRRRFLYGIFL